MVNPTPTSQKTARKQKQRVIHCNSAVAKSHVKQKYQSRTVFNSNLYHQGSVNWRANYYRFVDISYVQVVKWENINKRDILHNTSENVFC